MNVQFGQFIHVKTTAGQRGAVAFAVSEKASKHYRAAWHQVCPVVVKNGFPADSNQPEELLFATGNEDAPPFKARIGELLAQHRHRFYLDGPNADAEARAALRDIQQPLFDEYESRAKKITTEDALAGRFEV